MSFTGSGGGSAMPPSRLLALLQGLQGAAPQDLDASLPPPSKRLGLFGGGYRAYMATQGDPAAQPTLQVAGLGGATQPVIGGDPAAIARPQFMAVGGADGAAAGASGPDAQPDPGLQASGVQPRAPWPDPGQFRPLPPVPQLPSASAGAPTMPPPQAPPSRARTTANGAAFIKSYERGPTGDFAPTPYRSPEGGAKTVGWGHKIQPGQDFSRPLTRAQADALFLSDLKQHEALVAKSLKVPVSPQQFDALVALSYNTPRTAITKSTLMRDLNGGNVQGAADQFRAWNKAGQPLKPMPGLIHRREAERNIFLNGVYANH